MFKTIILFFDKLEDKVREHLSKYPIIYALIGCIAVIMLWRAIWESIDILYNIDNGFLKWFFYPPVQIIVSVAILLVTGLLVSNFIGYRTILSGLKKEKKMEDQTEKILKEEEITLKEVMKELSDIKKDLEEVK
jgi:hypothetical protein